MPAALRNLSAGAGLAVHMASGAEDVLAAQRLRYRVFVTELGGGGPMVDHDEGLERDRFDAFADHLLLEDPTRSEGDRVVGVYRLMTEDMASKAGQFYCEGEYDLQLLRQSGRKLLELGRSCLHPDYRGGTGMMQMWSALAAYAEARGIDVLFGVASFHGTDIAALDPQLSLLRHRHLAPPALRVTARGTGAVPLGTLPESKIDRIAAVSAMPALIKGYLRLGGTVGDGAFVDHAFNTTDICLILEKSAIRSLQKTIYRAGGRRG